MTDADIELQHLWLEVQTERWQNLPRFLFSYYCYKHNLVSKTNKVCWETARARLPASTSIKERKKAVVEPLVSEETVVGLLKTIIILYLLTILIPELRHIRNVLNILII